MTPVRAEVDPFALAYYALWHNNNDIIIKFCC